MAEERFLSDTGTPPESQKAPSRNLDGACGAGGVTRTRDLLITSEMLYRLSYTSALPNIYYSIRRAQSQPKSAVDRTERRGSKNVDYKKLYPIILQYDHFMGARLSRRVFAQRFGRIISKSHRDFQVRCIPPQEKLQLCFT